MFYVIYRQRDKEMTSIKEELDGISWGWKLLLIIGGILIIKAIFALNFTIGASL